MIYLTGDLHGCDELIRFKTDYINLKEKDFIIQLGDAGIIWFIDEYGKNVENKKLNIFEKTIPATMLIVLGNHENYDRIYNEFPRVYKYGMNLIRIRENIYFIENGQMFTLEDKTFFNFGGASSVDKLLRQEYISWWRQEECSYIEQINALELTKGKSIDYILSHTASSDVINKYFRNNRYPIDSTSLFLTELTKGINYKHHYFGHFHHDKQWDDKNTCLYVSIKKLE
jgi:hypothetical protein